MTMPVQKPHRSKQNYATPENFIEAIQRRLKIAAFSFDFAADATNAKADHWWTEANDSPNQTPQTWVASAAGGFGWLNPPFTNIEPWARRCSEMRLMGGRVALLVPASVGANWFRDYVDGHAYVLMLNGRLCFMPDKPGWLYPKDCILCLYAQTIKPGYEVWDWRRDIPSERVA
jgi:phage N-6-adenine-methyltransferase